ncbi:uncharacterized protein BBA_04105 [Beauveria bassiana ARSEF 2860]|uniref:Uncharacterized protein n=1 Tax=Beauveria bassiana (strain ARSEF 2860) TaxID=655819 RepID=J4UNY7_BEAB2|nr:uncharacterized protein BBA_04105 [Beauveria bassiana ARSEF 2860]EJP66812.1 hypothetical protein BBA_04105 [Beauveria bassiana ARSEF 2860]
MNAGMRLAQDTASAEYVGDLALVGAEKRRDGKEQHAALPTQARQPATNAGQAYAKVDRPSKRKVRGRKERLEADHRRAFTLTDICYHCAG